MPTFTVPNSYDFQSWELDNLKCSDCGCSKVYFGASIQISPETKTLRIEVIETDYIRHCDGCELLRKLNSIGIECLPATNFDFRISKDDAERLLHTPLNGYRYSIMCAEYGFDSDWVGIESDDVDETGKLDSDYQTFEIWLS